MSVLAQLTKRRQHFLFLGRLLILAWMFHPNYKWRKNWVTEYQNYDNSHYCTQEI